MRTGLGCLLVSAVLGVPAAGWAQSGATPETERPTEATTRGLERLEELERAGAVATLPPGKRVSFDEVMKRPDDVDLNFRWALTQVADGNLTGAAATLERILLVEPGLERVRMMYAIVLMRLGDLERADRELAMLETDTGAQRERIERYQRQIRQSRKTTRSRLTLYAGTQADSNRNAGPDSNSMLVANVRQTVPTGGKKTADQGWFSLTDLRIEHDLGTQENLRGVAGFTYFHSQQEDLEQLDVQAVRLALGLSGRRGSWELEPRLVSDLVNLSREGYLRTAGVEIDARVPLSSKLALRGQLRALHEDYDSSPVSPTARERTGYRSGLDLHLDFAPRLDHRLTLRSSVGRKSARKTYFSSLSFRLGLSHIWVLGSGLYLTSGLEAYQETFHRNQDAVSSSKRRDFQVTGRMGVGVPLDRLLGEPGGALSGLALTVSGELVLTDSNVPNFEYRNRKLLLGISKRFDF